MKILLREVCKNNGSYQISFQETSSCPNNSILKIVLFGAFSPVEDLQKEIPEFLSTLRNQRDRKSHYGDRAKDKDIWLNDLCGLFQPRWSCDIESSEAATSWGNPCSLNPLEALQEFWDEGSWVLSYWSIVLSQFVSCLYILKFTLKEPLKDLNYFLWIITHIRSCLQIQACFPALHPFCPSHHGE